MDEFDLSHSVWSTVCWCLCFSRLTKLVLVATNRNSPSLRRLWFFFLSSSFFKSYSCVTFLMKWHMRGRRTETRDFQFHEQNSSMWPIILYVHCQKFQWTSRFEKAQGGKKEDGRDRKIRNWNSVDQQFCTLLFYLKSLERNIRLIGCHIHLTLVSKFSILIRKKLFWTIPAQN